MHKAVNTNVVKSIGVSNHGERYLKGLFGWNGLKYKPIVNQIESPP